MKLKTLLLSSAAAFAVVGGAQAADLSVAEPVDYVKVCDAFGAGYWYIPGTDTCLKIGGLVRMDIKFHKESANDVSASISADPYEETGAASYADHRSTWDFATEYHLDVLAKTMTEFGPLTAYAELRAQSNNADASNNTLSLGATSVSDNGKYVAYLDSAYLELGMLLVGRTGSVYDYSGGFNWDWMDFDSDNGADQVRLTWAMSGFGIQLAIEDPRDRWGTDLTRGTWGTVSVDEGFDADGAITSDDYSMPNIVGNITWSQGKWSGQLSGGFAETRFGSGFGAQIATTLKLDQIAPGDALMLKAAWAENQVWKFAASTGPSGDSDGSLWSMAASFQHFWAPTVSSAVTFQYFDQTGGENIDDLNAYSIVGNLVWAPVTGFYAGVEGGYSKYSNANDGTWGVKVRLERDW